MKNFIKSLPRYVFFTGKGGVGKTSMACASALGLAKQGKRVLLISTDPASNLDEVLETPLASSPTAIHNVPGLFALNIDPIVAASEYRERMGGPYRGVLPEAAITQMEEQLSGACTVEIAGFNEFSKLLSEGGVGQDFEHVVLDTAPTGHTLRLLNLPSAWNDFIVSNENGSSCLGPVAGLAEQREMFEQVVGALKDPVRTLLTLVSRAESMTLAEAARASLELGELGLSNQHLIINGLFTSPSQDAIAAAFAAKSSAAIAAMPERLQALPSTTVPFRPAGIMGLKAIENIFAEDAIQPELADNLCSMAELDEVAARSCDWERYIEELEQGGKGVIMTMGKGGVGKTVMAAAIAAELARRGNNVILSTTDPAAHVAETVGNDIDNLTVERIDPKLETSRYVDEVLTKNRGVLSDDEMALLEEEMRSPCIEEIAVFTAFAQTVAKGGQSIVVLDTAPTGHTLLLLDATQSYHREVSKSTGELPEAVKTLLPCVRDPNFTKVLIVALPEATPTHEASALQDDLRRAGIEPFGWIMNRSFAYSGTQDPVLCAKSKDELLYLNEVLEQHSKRTVISPWCPEELTGTSNLKQLIGYKK